ncbi:MAG: type II toxin-antitoxin system VapC family toxin [Patescibacteria group bacterium]|nr:type II toxin-antitoxin system VapC family toxin [Patescibacteria group bacterium]
MEQAIFDASFFLSFLLPDEESCQKTLRKFIEGELLLVEPFIFSLEVINALRYAFASKRIPKSKLISLIESFQKIDNIDYIYDFNLQELVKTSLKFDISVYDSCYLYLSQKTGIKLYSLDKKLTGLI